MIDKYLDQLLTQHFRSTGYFKHYEVLPARFINEIIAAVNKEVSLKNPPFKLDDRKNICRLDNAYQRADIFEKLAKHPIILNPLQIFLGPNIELVLNRHNHITINKSTRYRLHRDTLQWSRSLVTAIVYLEESTTENGCTEIIPATHLLPFHGKVNNGGTWLDENSRYSILSNQSIPIPMPKGGILFFDSLAFHTPGRKINENSRMSITLGYHSVDELNGKDKDPNKVLVMGERIYRGNIKFED